MERVPITTAYPNGRVSPSISADRRTGGLRSASGGAGSWTHHRPGTARSPPLLLSLFLSFFLLLSPEFRGAAGAESTERSAGGREGSSWEEGGGVGYPRDRDYDYPIVAKAVFPDAPSAVRALVSSSSSSPPSSGLGDLEILGKRRRGNESSIGGFTSFEVTFLLRDESDLRTMRNGLSSSLSSSLESDAAPEVEYVSDPFPVSRWYVDEEETAFLRHEPVPLAEPLPGEMDIEGGGGESRGLSGGGSGRSLGVYENMSRYDYRFGCYRTVEGTTQTAEDMVLTHPSLASLTQIGMSVEGRPLTVLVLTNSLSAVPEADRAPLFVMSGLHPREYAPPEVAARFAERLVSGYGSDPAATNVLDTTVVHLLLQANPDGRVVSERDYRTFWRKNRNPGEVGCGTYESWGVDLNRNFPFEWGLNSGSTPNPCMATYRGSGPGSEPETQAFMAYSAGIFHPDQAAEAQNKHVDDPYDESTSAGLFVDMHSYGEDIIFPWGFKDKTVGNVESYSVLASKLSLRNSYQPSGSGLPSFLGQTSGDTIDYHYGSLGVASILIEMGTSFAEGCEALETSIAPDNSDALMYAASVAGRPYEAARGPEVESVMMSPNSIKQGTTAATVTLTVAMLSNADATAVVAEFRVLINGIGPIPATVAMGSLSTATSALVLDGASLSQFSVGRHTVCVDASDHAGRRGPVSCTFLDVAVRCRSILEQSECTAKSQCGWKVRNGRCRRNRRRGKKGGR